MTGAGLVYGSSSQKGDILAMSVLAERYDSRHGLRLVKYRFILERSKFQPPHSFSSWKKCGKILGIQQIVRLFLPKLFMLVVSQNRVYEMVWF